MSETNAHHPDMVGEHGGHYFSNVHRAMIFMTFIIFCACATQIFLTSIQRWIKIPYSVGLYTFGLLVGVAGQNYTHTNFGSSVSLFAVVDPHIIFFVFLPPLLYESAANMNFHVFKRVLFSSFLLAIPGVFINILLLAGILMPLLQITFWEAALGASILAATDPVAVVAALSSLGAPDSLSHLIEGESLLNDGSAVVVFLIIQQILGISEDHEITRTIGQQIGGAIATFCQLAIGGTCMGVLFGVVLILVLRLNSWLNHSHALLEVSVTGVALWGCFFLCEYLSLSGVLGVVALGSVMSAVGNLEYSNHEVQHKVHIFIEQISYFANQSLFFIAGVISLRYLFYINKRSHLPFQLPEGIVWSNYDNHIASLVGAIFGTYLAIHVTRFLITLLFYPVMARVGYSLKINEVVFISLAGLRGAVGIALILLLEGNTSNDIIKLLQNYDDDDDLEDLQEKLGLFQTALKLAFVYGGIVLLTLIVNGSLTDFFFKILKIDPISTASEDYLRNILCSLDQTFENVTNPSDTAEGHLSTWFLAESKLDTILYGVPKFSECLLGFHGKVPMFKTQYSVTGVLNSLEEEGMAARKSSLGSDAKIITEEEWKWPSTETFGKVCSILLKKLNEKKRKGTNIRMRNMPSSINPLNRDPSFRSSVPILSDMKCFSMELEDRLSRNKLFCEFIFNISSKEYTKLVNHGFLARSGYAELKEGIDLGIDSLKSYSAADSPTLPIEEQFMHLTRTLSKPCLTDRGIFRHFERHTYRWRYKALREKVQLLAAYIYVTEHVLDLSTEIYHLEELFPELQECLETEVELAREVYLKALSEISSRRYFFVRQELGLRYLLNVKKRLVEDYIEEGKMSALHGEVLLRICVEKPIRELDRFSLGPPKRQKLPDTTESYASG